MERLLCPLGWFTEFIRGFSEGIPNRLTDGNEVLSLGIVADGKTAAVLYCKVSVLRALQQRHRHHLHYHHRPSVSYRRQSAVVSIVIVTVIITIAIVIIVSAEASSLVSRIFIDV